MKKTFLIVLLLLTGTAFSQKKPNIIIFISDDHSQIDMGAYGNEDVMTPNMDKLASQGMKFTRAYASTSMCTPSRCSMFTGLYPFRNGSQMNHFGVKPGTKSLPHYLKDLGYRVVLAGKTHISPASSFPFEYISKEMGQYAAATRSDRKGETVKFIKDFFSDKNNKDQPLCLIVATWWPHMPWMKNKDYNPAEIDVPGYLIDTGGTREALAAYYQSITEADKLLGRIMQALEDTGEQKKTIFMYTSDQGVQLPGAKWTAYDQGLRVPFIVRWPRKVDAGGSTDALISLTDLTPTLIDLAGGEPVNGLDGKSFADVFLGKKEQHRDYVFAETSVEPHYWYNYVPARTIITKDGMHYIRNYNYGARFLTHIDAMEINKYYFDTWLEAAREDEDAAFLLNRYSYRPPEELYDLTRDPWELNNLLEEEKMGHENETRLSELRQLLDNALESQGETEEMIVQGQLPEWFENSYEIKQGISAHPMSFKREKWNPDTLFVTGYIEGLDQQGVLFQYFNQFLVTLEDGKIGVVFDKAKAGSRKIILTEPLQVSNGHLVMKLTSEGFVQLRINGRTVLEATVDGDFTKINGGYVSAGVARGLENDVPAAFSGKIHDLRFTMNKLNGEN